MEDIPRCFLTNSLVGAILNLDCDINTSYIKKKVRALFPGYKLQKLHVQQIIPFNLINPYIHNLDTLVRTHLGLFRPKLSLNVYYTRYWSSLQIVPIL